MATVLKLSNANVIDIRRRELQRDVDIYLADDGTIFSKQSHGSEYSGPEIAETISLDGQYLMPGLVDSHVHAKALLFPWDCGANTCNWYRHPQVLGLDEIGAMMLRAGVTAYVDMGSRPQEQMIDARNRQRDPATFGSLGYDSPDIFSTLVNFATQWGPYVGYPGEPMIGDQPSDHILFLQKQTANDTPYEDKYGHEVEEIAGEVRRVVLPVLEKNPDVVKLGYPLLEDTFLGEQPSLHIDTVERIIELADSHGIPTMVHCEVPGGHAELIDRGAGGLSHLAMFWWNRPEAQAWDQLDFTGKRVYVVPTMSLAYGLPALRDGDLDDPLLQHVLGVLGSTGADYWTSLRDAFSDTTHSVSKRAKHLRNVFLDGYNSDPSLIESARRTRNKTLARYQEQTEQRKTDPDLERDGMVILAGTDAQNFGVVFGYSLHQELRAMVEDVGFGTWEALESATILPGEWLGVRYGVDKDDVANLLVLDKDPTENVRNLDSIRKVIHRSKVVVSV